MADQTRSHTDLCQHDPLKPKTTLRIETHVFAGTRIHCLKCDGEAAIGKKSGKFKLLSDETDLGRKP